MFPKPAFSGTTSGFGSFSSNTATASPFGGFKPTTGTSAFGAPPAFGANATAQPATGGGLFGSTNTSGGLFGGGATAAPSFGASSSLFGGTAAPSSGLFANTSGTMFNQQPPAFNAKPAGFGFGSTTTSNTTGGGLFGSTPTTGTGLFGQQNNTLGGGGLFSNTTGGAFGQQQQQQTGTAVVKYNPVVGTDVVVKSGTQQNVSIKHHCITCMKEYENKSLEELRLEDYTAGRKAGGGGGGVFSGFTAQTEAKPLFGSSFSQPTTTTAPSVFGGGGLTSTGYGAQNTFSFGQTAPSNTNTTGGFFGAAKPAFGATPTTGTNLFGSTTTQAPSFGTTTPSFGFGTNNQNQSGGLFAPKPAAPSFGAPAASSSFGSFGANTATSGGLFGKPQQSAAPAFSTNTPAFGSTPAFGANTGGGGMFNSSFNKPATTQPAFGFPTPSSGIGGGLSLNNSFAKPGVPNFGGGGGTSIFNTPTQNFTGGLGTSLGGGGGIFGNTSLGGPSLGMAGLGGNTGMAVNNNLSGASAAGNVHEQILTLVARPYGDSPLFKDLQPDTTKTAEDVLKPTNPAAVKAVLDRSASSEYRVTSPNIRLKLQPLPVTLTHDKKSLFDGLEESDASLEDKLTLKPSRKRLVLRPKSQIEDSQNDSVTTTTTNQNRSLDDTSKKDTSFQKEKENDTTSNNNSFNAEKQSKNISNPNENNNIEYLNIRNASWLNASRRQSNENEKPIDGEPTPRLYPNLDKELPMTISERRASWLTTKPLRKPLVSETDSAETTVRDLNVRSERLSRDKHSVDILSVSEEESVAPREMPPHPTGVKLTRPGYYTIPSLDEMIKYMRQDGSCVVPHLTIGRKNYGNVYYDCEMDVAGLDLDSLVHFLNKEVTIYPDDSDKPPVGEGLNRRAIVTLDRIWPRDKTDKRPITDPDRLIAMDYEGKLRRVCDKHDTKFVEYRPQTGSWVFRVEHFSKYSLTDSDDEDEITPEVIKRQLVNQQLQKAAPVAPPVPVAPPTPGLSFSGGLGGVGAAGGLGGLAQPPQAGLHLDTMYMMHQTSLNLLSNAGRVFDMDTTEDNTESQSLYQDSQRAYGVKSPTSELAKLENRQSHNVQLMKASLYADADMEDDVSVSTGGDQMVPRGVARSLSVLLEPATPAPPQLDDDADMVQHDIQDEVQMKPLIVRPHTVVLKYHRQVPPFKKTIAGRVNASCLADMSISRARHSRVGFGPSGNITFTTSYDSVHNLPKNTELCDIGNYIRGRSEDDWSEPIVVRMAIGQADVNDNMQAIIIKQLDTLLEMSTLSDAEPDRCPKLTLNAEPSARRQTLARLIKDCQPIDNNPQFGVTTGYYYEVLKLCEALWGADLDNDGIPGTDDHSIVNRHRKFVEWLTEAVAKETDRELSQPTKGEDEDELDGHSARIWTLMLGGRIVEACKVSVESGDLNMAALIAQAQGDPYVRSLISRQLSSWSECGAAQSVSSRRLSALRLIAGAATSRDLASVGWLRALHATARYLCPQVPSLEQIIQKYESLFNQSNNEEMDLSVVEEADEVGMKHPLPGYVDTYHVSVNHNGKERRILDLRYELIRARALNLRPKIQPASYTPDPLDYSLSLIVGVWLGCATPATISRSAAQLQRRGLWQRAVQVLAYHPDERLRSRLIREVLSRHAPASASPEDQARLDLIAKLRVPHKWVMKARAHRAKYEHLPLLEAEHLVAAEEWNAAHEVLIEQLMPDAVLSDNMASIKGLVEKLHEAAQRHEVSGWECGGQALYYYLQVEQSEAPSRSILYAAQSALNRLSVKLTPLVSAARAELAARLAAKGAHETLSITRATQIATDLAEQASELCIESSPSSPIQSHQATALVS